MRRTIFATAILISVLPGCVISLNRPVTKETTAKKEPVPVIEKKIPASVLNPDKFRHYIDLFNRMEDENRMNHIPNAESWKWLRENIPFFECPQDNIEEIYYFRWWSFRKHIIRTPAGYAFTEFLVPRSYADKYNLISCALGHHTYESRWLRDPQYLQDNLKVWFRGNNGGQMAYLRKFSSWTADALYNSYLVTGDRGFTVDMLPDLHEEYRLWENDHRLASGLFWQYDVADGMEESISGGRREKNARPTINSYMYGNAIALSLIAEMAGRNDLAAVYRAKADTLKNMIEEKLWNPGNRFFEVLKEDGNLSGAREAIGFIPWYFNLPSGGFEAAWEQISDENGFNAPFGLTTAERRHPEFRSHGCCNCEWDGAVWPFATSQTLTAMANLLNNYDQNIINDQYSSDVWRSMSNHSITGEDRTSVNILTKEQDTGSKVTRKEAGIIIIRLFVIL